MRQIFSGVACNLDSNILSASLPLFEAEKVEAIEWSFDTLFEFKEIPGWFNDLLFAYSQENRLIGHGVFFSIFSGKWLKEQENWLNNLKQLSQKFTFDHITEHFGFLTGQDFHKGAPLSIPYTPSALSIGIDRLKRIQDVCQCPVGLENLAFSYSLDEVKQHGRFLQKLIEPVNGFIILDLHNLFCQLHNFRTDFEALIALYPLHLVREIHISGGSWETPASNPNITVRRDTHDDAVPSEVFDLLQACLPRCPNLKFVIMEQLGAGLTEDVERMQFRQDFDKMQQITGTCISLETTPCSFLPAQHNISEPPIEDFELFMQQNRLSEILETARSVDHARQLLYHSPLAHTGWNIENWDTVMLETAIRIAQKWKDGFKSEAG